LENFDSPILKLDAADEFMFQNINKPCEGIILDEIIRNLKKIRNLTLQTLFLGGKLSNAEGEVYQKWLEVIAEIRPTRIQIYSTDRPVADIGFERTLPSRLIQIVEEVRNKLNYSIEAYWAT
jgi:wyosine [tRNA(Phe)-imidazoG37] synthetase (radical SAM superfamily)